MANTSDVDGEPQSNPYPTWTKEVAGSAPHPGSISQMIALPDGKILFAGDKRKPANRVWIFDPETSTSTSHKLPLTGAHAGVYLPDGRLLLIQHEDTARDDNTTFVLWDPMTGESQSFRGKMPPDQHVCADLLGDQLHIIASSSVGGSSGGFEWKSDMAWAGSLDLSSLQISTPFHPIEDIDANAIAMLKPDTCFVYAFSRTSGYCHLRNTTVHKEQEGSCLPGSRAKPDLSTPVGFNLTYVGRDHQGGLLFAGDAYSRSQEFQTALFRWTLEGLRFETVGRWNDGSCYFSEAASLNDGSTLLFFSERQSANMYIRRYVPGQKAQSVGMLTDTFHVRSVVQAAQGALYMYACKPALRDGKWLISGPWDLYELREPRAR